jgi:hypothetical protein
MDCCHTQATIAEGFLKDVRSGDARRRGDLIVAETERFDLPESNIYEAVERPVRVAFEVILDAVKLDG